MNAKVLDLVGAMQDGYRIAAIEDLRQGGVRIRLHRGSSRRSLRFAHFEVPAVLQECSCIGLAK